MSEVDIHPSATVGANVTIMGALTLGANVQVGANVTFFPDVRIGADTRIMPGAVIGRPPIRAGATNRPISLGDATVKIGAHCVISPNAVLYTNLRIGNNVLIGDAASLREGCQLGDDTVVGRGTMLMHDVEVGARSRIHNLACIVGGCRIEADVFIAPHVSSLNDNEVYLKRFGLVPFRINPPRIRRFAVVSAHVTLGAGIEVGRGAVIAPGAVAMRDVPAWTVVAGVPARHMRDVAAEDRQAILRKFGLAREEPA
ncbi:MAG: hypothetical protein OXE95_12935 [Chloroflexi bacterium]|nr:hypothetical protein [Chloroflexota bacterium]